MSSQPTIGTNRGPVPPAMHWFLLAFLTTITFGLFGLIWAFVQSGYVKKVSPKCNGRAFLFSVLAVNVAFMVFFLFTFIVMDNHQFRTVFSDEKEIVIPQIAFVTYVLITMLFVVAMFRIRQGLLTYYNTIEPIALRLSAPMTFFFNIYYFQYQFRRIAQWKKSGVPIAQSIGGIAVRQQGA